MKRREIAAFRLMSRDIDDESIKILARELYKRIHDKSQVDKEAQLADFIDKAQAVRFGLKNVFPAAAIRNRNTREIQLNHAITVLLKPADSFIQSLTSPYSKEEAQRFIKEVLESFTNQGYKSSEIGPHLSRASLMSANGDHP